MDDTPLRGYEIAGRYIIIGLLEDRGYGALYLAQDIENSDTRYLLKHTRDDSEWAWWRFQNELDWPINHTHLAPRIGVDWVSGNDLARGSWQVFERLGNGTLATWLTENNLAIEPTVAVQLMQQVCGAVGYLHTCEPRLLHKHITPKNVGLVKDAEGGLWVYLSDYGMTEVERPLQAHSAHAVAAGGRGAPEQFELVDVTDERTDVYAIGATLYELVTGQRPTSGITRSVERADVVNPNVPRLIADVISQAMSLDPRLRFHSAAELSAALEEAIRPDQPAHSGGNSINGGTLTVVMIVLFALGVIFWIAIGNNSSSVPQPTPLTIGGGGLPTSVPFTPAPTVPPTATPDIVATLAVADALLVPLVGPLAGELPASAAGTSPVLVAGPLADFAIEATFVNPNAPEWAYGFAFRHNETSHYRLSLANDGTWKLTYRTEDPADPLFFGETVIVEAAAPLALGAGETNHLRLLAVGPYGVVTINEQPVAQVDLSIKVEPGNVFIAAGLRATPNAAVVGYRDLMMRGSQ